MNCGSKLFTSLILININLTALLLPALQFLPTIQAKKWLLTLKNTYNMYIYLYMYELSSKTMSFNIQNNISLQNALKSV